MYVRIFYSLCDSPPALPLCPSFPVQSTQSAPRERDSGDSAGRRGEGEKEESEGEEATGGREKTGVGLHPPQRGRGAMESIAPSWCEGGGRARGRKGEREGGLGSEEGRGMQERESEQG